ncbi:MAG: PAS domain-containing protein, partial [Chromatiales bacterium]
MHPLLTRQLKRLFGISDEPKLAAALLELRQLANSDGLQEESRNLLEGLDRLLGQIDNTYQQHEADITLRDQSLEISNEEILQANEKLRRKERRQHAIIESLRRTANELLRSTHLPELSDDETSLEKLSLLMSDLVKERQQVQSKLERTLSELERQKSAIDQHAIVSITDTNGKVTYANEGFCRVSGYQRYELIGKKHPQFNQTDRSAAIIKKIWSTIRHGHTWKGEFANRNKTGTLYWLDATIVPFLDNQGEPSQYISICTDITERRIFQACRDAQDAKRDVQVPLLPSLITTVIS